MDLFVQMTLNGFVLATNMMLVGIGFMMLYSILRVVNLAHGELYMVSAMLVWYFSAKLHLAYFLAILLSTGIVIFLGLFMERFTLRRFRGDLLSGMIVSMGFVFILQQGALLTFGTEGKTLPAVFEGTLKLFGVQFSTERIVVSLISLAVVGALVLYIKRFKAGWAMQAISQDEDAARLQGVSIRNICRITMGIGCGITAIAGGLMAPLYMVSPTMGLPFLLKTMIAMVLGGIGSIGGAVLGALIVGMLESYVSTLISIEIAYVVLFGILAVILVVKPGGFFGTPFEYT